MKTLPDKLIIAVARYYHGRDQVGLYNARCALHTLNLYIFSHGSMETNDAPTWDKNTALKIIDDVCKPLDISHSSSAGTFWFHRMVGKRLVCFQVNESNYLDGGVRSVQVQREGKWVDYVPRKKSNPQEQKAA